MKKNRYFLFFAFCFSINLAFSQSDSDLQWWSQAHNWDGITHWSRYIIRMPGYLGPNALPIPTVKNARIDNTINLETAFEYHKGKGEFAYNPYLNLSIPIAKEKVALDLIYRPFEYYETEEYIGLERFVRYRACKGTSKGDLYIGTILHLLNENEHFINGNVEIYLKTTTGKNLANARHIDAPAYYFNLNLGKSLYNCNGFLNDISIYTMAGFYAWQADLDNNRQNDAYLYGLRSDFTMKPFSLSFTFSGYSGYMKMRDKPMAMRFALNKNFKHSTAHISYQNGMRDVIKNSLRLGYIYRFH